MILCKEFVVYYFGTSEEVPFGHLAAKFACNTVVDRLSEFPIAMHPYKNPAKLREAHALLRQGVDTSEVRIS
eukprot:5465943-Amphidinium_carterae.1